jgi:lambda family phage portal protein
MAVTIKITPSGASSLVQLPVVGVAPRSALLRRPAARAFDAAKSDRLNADWKVSNVGPNYDLRNALSIVRDKARDLVANDDYAKGFIRQKKVNIVGPHGFSLKINPTLSDEKFRDNARRIQDKFRLWCESEYCTLSQEHEFVDVQNSLITYAARDGEFCVRIIRDKRMKFGFTQQILPIELLDETYIDTLDNNRVVILGIEYDRVSMRRLAYWFRDVPLEMQVYGATALARGRMRIPADEIIHGFDSEFENQARGISWMVQSMNSMRMLSKYDEATLIAARMRATVGGFITSKGDLNPEFEGESEDEEGNKIFEVENGLFKTLPPNMEVAYSDNNFPSAQYEMYVQQNLRRQSVGLDVAGSVHSGNYKDVNFSSERARQIAVRDSYVVTQQWFIRKYLKRIGRIFMKEAYISGAITYPMAQEELYGYHVWSGRRWAYVNPQQEMAANAMKWSMGLKSISEMIMEGDGELEPQEVFAMIQADNKMAEKYGFQINGASKEANTITPPEDDPEDEPKDGEPEDEPTVEDPKKIKTEKKK